jgi:transposase
MVYRKISDDVKTISLELQDRGFSLDEVADLLSVSARSINRWKNNFDTYYTVNKPPQLPRGRPRKIPVELLDALHIMIQAEPSAYLEEMRTWLLYEHGIIISVPTIDQNLRWLGLTHKKLTTLAKERNDNKRFNWREWVNTNFMASQIICTDESYKDARTHSRSYGRAIRGQDAFELTAFVRGQRFSILPALSTDGIIAAHIVEGAVNGEIFIEFIVNQVVSYIAFRSK